MSTYTITQEEIDKRTEKLRAAVRSLTPEELSDKAKRAAQTRANKRKELDKKVQDLEKRVSTLEGWTGIY